MISSKDLQLAVHRGYSLIPVKDKKPLVDWEIYQRKRADLSTVLSWNKKWPESQFGIVTGPISNLVVIDIDGQEGHDALKQYSMPQTLSVKTRRGDHKYFRWNDSLNNRVTTKMEMLPKVDIRGEGGYVVAWDLPIVPPQYSLAMPPEWLLDLLPNKSTPVREVKDEGWVAQQLNAIAPGKGAAGRTPTFVRVIGYLKSKGLTVTDTLTLLEPWAAEYKYDKIQQLVEDQYKRYPNDSSTDEKEVKVRSFQNSLEDYKGKVAGRGKFEAPELSTGFRAIDEATWGLHRGDIFTIGARTGIGKTCLCITSAATLAKAGSKVLYISTEMSYDEIFDRFIAVVAEVPTFQLANGTLSETDKIKLQKFYDESSKYNFHIFDGLEPSVKNVKTVLEEVRPDVLFFDHIQHIATTSENQVRELERFTKGLKTLAKEFNCAVVVASQLNRSVEFNVDTVPQIHHLKGCGAIEEESSQVLLLARTGPDDNTSEYVQVIANLAKNRNGKQVMLEMQLNKKLTRFEEIL